MTKLTIEHIQAAREQLEKREVNLEFHFIPCPVMDEDDRELPDYMLETELMYADY